MVVHLPNKITTTLFKKLNIMKNLKVSIAKITEVVNSTTEEKLQIKWKREGLSFVGTPKETCEGMSTLQVNLRKSALKANAEQIEKALNEIGLDCDYIAGIVDSKEFYIRLTVKDLTLEPAAPVVAPKTAAAPKDKTVPVAKVEKGPGVIATILEAIKSGPQTQASIIDKLVFAFPEREVDAMKKTVAAQIGSFKKQPTRMEKEKNVRFEITIDKDGVPTYAIAKLK